MVDVTISLIGSNGDEIELADSGDFVLASGVTGFGIPATNKDVDVIGCTIATIVNGKITEERDFMDMLEFLQQLGIMPR